MTKQELDRLFSLHHDLSKNFLYEMLHIPVYHSFEDKTVRSEISCISDSEMFIVLKEAMSKYKSLFCILLFAAATLTEWVVEQHNNDEEFRQLYGLRDEDIPNFQSLITEYRDALEEYKLNNEETGYGKEGYMPLMTARIPS